jgi:hypothetical protein
LQRSEQNGRQGLALSHFTLFPHCGQLTVGTAIATDCRR